MPTASYSHQATANAPIDDVWRALQDAATWGGLAGVQSIADPAHDGDGSLEGFTFTVAIGGQKYQGRANTAESDGEEKMVVRITSSELEGTIRVELGEADGTTRLDVDLKLAPKSLLATMFFPAISHAVGNGLGRQVEDLADRIGTTQGA